MDNVFSGLTPQGILEFVQRAAQQAGQQPAAPAIDVPTVVVPDPVTVRGTLEMQVTFPHNLIGLPYNELVDRVFQVIINRQEGFDFPRIEFGRLELRREQSESQARAEWAAAAGNNSWGIPEARPGDDQEYAGNPPVGDAGIADETGVWGVTDQPSPVRPSPDFIESLLGTASSSRGSGETGDGDSDSGESGISGPGREPIEQTGEEEDREGSE
jgi:hypothetical protein